MSKVGSRPDGGFLQSLLLCRLFGVKRTRCAQSELF
jgi:hypothetical protein